MPSQHPIVSRTPQPFAATALTVLLSLSALPLSASAQLTLSTQLSTDTPTAPQPAVAAALQSDAAEPTALRASSELSPPAASAEPTASPAAAPLRAPERADTEATKPFGSGNRPSALQRLGNSLHGLWSRVQDHLSWPFTTASASDAPADTRSALLADLGSRRSLRSSGLMLYSQEAADGSVRASMGLIQSDSGNWWQTRSDRYAALRSSYHRLSDAGVLSSAGSQVPCDTFQARPYVGASFSSLLSPTRSTQAWRVNADFGLVSMGNTRTGLATTPERNADDLLRDVRLRPNVKVSLGYSF